MPELLRAAADSLDEREQQLRDAEATVADAREALAAAHQRDVDELAAAREAGEPDPPARHEAAARETLVAAEQDLEIMQARVAKLGLEYEQLAVEQRPKWLGALEREWNKIDKTQRRRAQELAAGFGRQLRRDA
jgi:hypothetical protein